MTALIVESSRRKNVREFLFDVAISAPGVDKLQAEHKAASETAWHYHVKPRAVTHSLNSDVLLLIAESIAAPGTKSDLFEWSRLEILPDGSLVEAHIYIELKNVGNPQEVIEVISRECLETLNSAADEFLSDPIGMQRKACVKALMKYKKSLRTYSKSQEFTLWRELCTMQRRELLDSYDRLPTEKPSKKPHLRAV